MLMVFMSQPDFACNCHALWKYVKQHTDFETAWIIKKPAYYEICLLYTSDAADE